MSPRINQNGVTNRYEDDWSQEDYENLKRRSDLSAADRERLEAYEEAGYVDDADEASETKGTEGGATSPGNSSPASSDKTVKSGQPTKQDPQSPAPTTAQSSKKDQTGSSTASSTGGSGKANR